MKEKDAPLDPLEIFSQIKKLLPFFRSFRRDKNSVDILNLLKDIARALQLVRKGGKNLLFDLTSLSRIQIESCFNLIGLGKLCIFYPHLQAVYAAQQTAFPGVWWMEKKERQEKVSSLYIEVGRIPGFVFLENKERIKNPDLKTALCSLGSSRISLQALVSSLVSYTCEQIRDKTERKIHLNLLPLMMQDIKTLHCLLPKTDFTIYSREKQAWIFGTPWKNIWWFEEVADPQVNQKSIGLLICEFPYSLFPDYLELDISARRLEKIAA
ncbi:hydrogenase [Methylacidiphilum caldifontis]|uniref:hydrogenase expression/formation C-terminal domain-containing protein n=1 Tax=Methylacidiphilum caldifontis TaxID=2795386 RepID=UPI001A8C4A01|nr:hydrogenase expression/formation C-terminal domain-containing protein [Methylacidiphilum caldifontis]QSR88541.1 hydrogenase [Methylacidiphilum caldifontis]